LPDGEFVSRIVEQADCYILLDLHNLLKKEINGRQTVKEFLKQIPLERVIEIHVAGGFVHGKYYLDAYSGISSDHLFEITTKTVKMLPNLKALVFEMLPGYLSSSLNNFRSQFDQMQWIWDKRGTDIQLKRKPLQKPVPDAQYSPQNWEYTLGNLVLGRDIANNLAQELSQDPAIETIKELIYRFRTGAIVDSIPLTSRLLLIAEGKEAFEKLLGEFFQESNPIAFDFESGELFVSFLKGKKMNTPFLEGIMEYELATIHTIMDKQVRMLRLDFNPLPVLEALQNNACPSVQMEEVVYELEITPEKISSTNQIKRFSTCVLIS